jgi:hypothetical protein
MGSSESKEFKKADYNSGYEEYMERYYKVGKDDEYPDERTAGEILRCPAYCIANAIVLPLIGLCSFREMERWNEGWHGDVSPKLYGSEGRNDSDNETCHLNPSIYSYKLEKRDILTITYEICDAWLRSQNRLLHPIFKTKLSPIERKRFQAKCIDETWDFSIFGNYFHYIPRTYSKVESIYNYISENMPKKYFEKLLEIYTNRSSGRVKPTGKSKRSITELVKLAIVIHSQKVFNHSVGKIPTGSIVIFFSLDPRAGGEFKFPGHTKIVVEQLDGNFVKSMGIWGYTKYDILYLSETKRPEWKANTQTGLIEFYPNGRGKKIMDRYSNIFFNETMEDLIPRVTYFLHTIEYIGCHAKPKQILLSLCKSRDIKIRIEIEKLVDAFLEGKKIAGSWCSKFVIDVWQICLYTFALNYMSKKEAEIFVKEIIPLNSEHCSPVMLWNNLPSEFWRRKMLYISPVRSLEIPKEEADILQKRLSSFRAPGRDRNIPF